MTQDSNPPAFPSRMDKPMLGGGSYRNDRPGMTLRDWFAGRALGGMLTHENMPWSADHAEIEASTIAGAAYELADAMLAERQKGGDA